MSYSAEISRRSPTLFVFLVDWSGSMADPFGGGQGVRKASFVADALNRILQNLVIRANRGEEVYDYFHLGVIGYGAFVGPALGGALSGRQTVSVSDLAMNPLRVETRQKREPDGAGGVIEVETRFPVWFDAQASGGTPMCQALELAEGLVRQWVTDHPDSYPPTVLNITDGESTDGEPTEAAARITSLATTDGAALMMNLHASTARAAAVTFPSSKEELPSDAYAQLMFSISSALPPHMLSAARELCYSVSDGARAFVFNSGVEDVVSFLDIGTRTPALR